MRSLSNALAIALQVLFGLVAFISLVSAPAAFGAGDAFESYMQTRNGFDERQSWQDAHNLFSLVTSIGSLVAVGLLVVMIVWSWKAHRAANSLYPGVRKWRIGWTIGAWFIPCASILLPKLVLDETEKIASAPRIGGVAAGWKGTPSSLIGWAWWCLFVISNFFVFRGNFITVDSGPTANLSQGDISGFYSRYALGSLIAATSAVCGVFYVRRVSSRLSAASLQASGVGLAAHGSYGLAPTVMGGPSIASMPNGTVDAWATATASADAFCEICRGPLPSSAPRCPRCGKRRQPSQPAPT